MGITLLETAESKCLAEANTFRLCSFSLQKCYLPGKLKLSLNAGDKETPAAAGNRDFAELSQQRALAEGHGRAHGLIVFAFRLLQERWKRW